MRNILAVLLTLSIILNVMFWYNPSLFSGGCTVTPGFENPTTYSGDEAQRYTNNFKNSMPAGTINGGIITRSAFDEMMCTDKCNGIAYSFAKMDDKPETGVFVIYNGVNVTVNNGIITKVTNIGTPYFYTSPRNWCPPSCNAW